MMLEHTTHFDDCGCLTARKDAEIAALSARVAELEDKLAQAEQVSGDYCEKCGWAMKFPNQPCRCELEAENARLREESQQNAENVRRMMICLIVSAGGQIQISPKVGREVGTGSVLTKRDTSDGGVCFRAALSVHP